MLTTGRRWHLPAEALSFRETRRLSSETHATQQSVALHPDGLLAVLAAGAVRTFPVLHPASAAGGVPKHALEFEPEDLNVSCCAWLLDTGRVEGGCACLLLGTSGGCLHLVADDGKQILRQLVSQEPILAISSGPLQDATDEAIITITCNQEVILIPMQEVQAAVHLWRYWDHDASAANATLRYDKWLLPKSAGARNAACCIGYLQPNLYNFMTNRELNAKLCIMTAGRDLALSSYWAHEQLPDNALAAASQTVSAMAANTRQAANAVMFGRKHGYRAGVKRWLRGTPQGVAAPAEDLPGGMQLLLHRSLQDGSRSASEVLIAPGGQLAAAADSIGRVLLVDSASLAVLRIWRAYRNAQLAWLLLPSQCADSQPGPAAQPVPASGPHAPTGPTGSQHRLQLALVLYAPRRGVVEVWQVERGPCLLRLTVSQDASLLTPSCLGGTHSQGVGAERWRLQRQCWLLDWAAGEVLDVAAAVAEARPGG